MLSLLLQRWTSFWTSALSFRSSSLDREERVQQMPPLDTEKVKLKVVAYNYSAYNYSMGHFDLWLDLGCTSVATNQDQDHHSE